MTNQPTFRYHPDPVGTGSAVPTSEPCGLCHQPTDLRYEGPVYAEQEPEIDVVCLRCIADGSAARAFGSGGELAEFTDAAIRNGVVGVPRSVVEEVAHRTPGFASWQSEEWMYHCADAAAFLGCVGWPELGGLPDALSSLRGEYAEDGPFSEANDDRWHFLDADGDATAYLFRCLHCGVHLAYWDAN